MSQITLKALVQKYDPDWSRISQNPLAYEFSNGRKFYTKDRPDEPYPWWGTGSGT